MEHPQKGTFCMSEALPEGEALIMNLKAFRDAWAGLLWGGAGEEMKAGTRTFRITHLV